MVPDWSGRGSINHIRRSHKKTAREGAEGGLEGPFFTEVGSGLLVGKAGVDNRIKPCEAFWMIVDWWGGRW